MLREMSWNPSGYIFISVLCLVLDVLETQSLHILLEVDLKQAGVMYFTNTQNV